MPNLRPGSQYYSDLLSVHTVKCVTSGLALSLIVTFCLTFYCSQSYSDLLSVLTFQCLTKALAISLTVTFCLP